MFSNSQKNAFRFGAINEADNFHKVTNCHIGIILNQHKEMISSLLKISTLLVALSLVSSQQICKNYMSTTKDSVCYQIFHELEMQIVESESNLFSLRKVFYPTSQAEPTLVNVSYALDVSAKRNISCPGDPETPQNRRWDHLTESDRNSLQVQAWSSKVFYTIFHPATINRLQPQALQWILVMLDDIYGHTDIQTAFTWSTDQPIVTVELAIDIQLPCFPTLLALEMSLKDLTSVVSFNSIF